MNQLQKIDIKGTHFLWGVEFSRSLQQLFRFFFAATLKGEKILSITVFF